MESKTQLGQVKLYNDKEIELSIEQLELIENYNKIIGYQEFYEKDLSKTFNGGIDLQGSKIQSNGILHEKLVNIEMFSFNAINNIFGLGLEKISNKKVLNKGADFAMSGANTVDSRGPAYMLEIKKGFERVNKNFEYIEEIQNKVLKHKKTINYNKIPAIQEKFIKKFESETQKI